MKTFPLKTTIAAVAIATVGIVGLAITAPPSSSIKPDNQSIQLEPTAPTAPVAA